VRLYNTLTRRLEELPAPPGPIRMYFCGPTVYARAHIGNARPFILGMWLRNWLRHRGYDATLVHNITDVNDKIYDAAPGASAELGARATEWYLEDTGDLGLGMPDALPKATESIPAIVRFIEELLERDAAYAVEGDVYFRVASDPAYGRLSGQRPDQVEQGEEPSALKEDPRDFALWKAQKPGEDTAWDAPWGRGRPGWHIECSAMAEEAFGPVFEIHGGGLDLVFPHHENELAQSSALGHEFARIWTHNGMLEFGGEKMSKSLGNDVSLRNVLDTWGREVVLLFFMTGHWRKPIDFTDETLQQAKAQWTSFSNALLHQEASDVSEQEWARLTTVLDDDLNTPEALALMHDWRRRGRHAELVDALALFGLATKAAEAPPEVVALAERRQQARKSKDFAESDRLRDEIAAAGWDVRDEAGGFRLVARS
jgi:cysteinyl-tRNA synthetase